MDKLSRSEVALLISARDSGVLPVIFSLIKAQAESYDIFQVPKDQKEIFQRERDIGSMLVLQDLDRILLQKITTLITEYGRDQGN